MVQLGISGNGRGFVFMNGYKGKSEEMSFRLWLFRVGGVAGLAGLLAACASNVPQPRQQIPIAQEVAHYQSIARSHYTPPGPPEDPWGPYIREASARFDVPEIWIRAVMQQESGGNLYHNGQLVTSGPGAMGLMQLMPPTYDDMKTAYNLGDDAYDPHDNIMAGTAYIRQMYDIYGSPGFLAAYNGGPGRLDDFLTRNRTLPLETRRYVASIGVQIQGIKPNRQSQADLLVEGHENGMGVNPAQYASAAQPASSNSVLSPQAQAVREAWTGRQTTDTLNQASLNRMGTAVTDNLNNQSLQNSGGYPQVAMAPQSEVVSNAYPVKWKNFDSRSTSGSVTGNETRQDVSEAWQARGYQPVSAQPVRQDAVRQVSVPSVTPVSYQKRYYKPVSYQIPSSSVPVSSGKRGKRRLESSVSAGDVVQPALGDWGIQVGAFASPAQAREAVDMAKSKAFLRTGRQQVQVVQKGKSRVYRARVTGLSQTAALNACRRLVSCMLIKPGNSL